MPERPPDRLARLLPQHHRALDAGEGRPLEALLRLLAHELDIVEDDIDRLYDNWFIETCEPWAVPYIGDLVGARPLRPFRGSGAGLRAHVANTISYRQSKGAAAAIEQMARDVTGWPSVAVEFFQRLVWSQHVNHVRPAALGTVSLRDAEGARMTGGPFETASHGAAAGRVTGPSGRYNIPHVGIFAWRLQSYTVGFLTSKESGYLGGPQPRRSALGPGFRHFDPLGTDRTLFNRPRADVDLATRATARNVPGRLDRSVLHRDLADLRDGLPGGGDWFRDPPALQIRLGGEAVGPEKLHACNLEDQTEGGATTWRRPSVPGEVYLDPVHGRLSLHPADEDADVEVAYSYGAPFDVGAGPQDRRGSVGLWWDDVLPEDEPSPFRVGVSSRAEDVTNDVGQGGPVVATLSAAIARWNAQASPGARGVITVMDSATYPQVLTSPARVIDIPAGARLAIVAAGWPREGNGSAKRQARGISPRNRRPHVQSSMRVRGTATEGELPGKLILDGILVEGEVRIEAGELGELALRHCTVGASAAGLAQGVRVVDGNELLGVTVDHSIVGRVLLGGAAGNVVVTDSILGEDPSADSDPATAAVVLDAEEADVTVARSTVLGRSRGRRLEAENTIFHGSVAIARRQSGCVRFSFVPPGSRTPAQYRCAPSFSLAEAAARLGRDLTESERREILARVAPQFASSAYGSDQFGTLALTCPPEIAEAAEDGAAMGVGFHLGEPFRRANLRDALDEYLPFGLDAGPIFVT